MSADGTPEPTPRDTIDLDAIEALAERVGSPRNFPAPWNVRMPTDDEFEGVGIAAIVENEGGKGEVTDWTDPDLAAYIAALDPATTLALIAEVRALRAECAAVIAATPRDELLAALEADGTLTEEFNVAGEDEDGGWVIDSKMSRDEASKLAARHDGFVTRRLVTRWEPLT